MIREGTFRHEVLLYDREDELLVHADAFIRKGLAAGEPTLVVLDPGKVAALRAGLGADADAVHFADMSTVGRNPARLIAAWRSFLADHAVGAAGVRGIGEPVWAGRSSDELVECRHHEALLNVAFADVPAFTLLCPYNTATLEPDVIAAAHGTHPVVTDGRAAGDSGTYRDVDPAGLLGEPLSPPPRDRYRLAFRSARTVRRFVSEHAGAAGLGREALDDVVLAVNELAANSLRHGGGCGVVSIWSGSDTLVCQVDDRGRITDPLIGRSRPVKTQRHGRGLWLVHQLADLTQLRSSDRGTTARLHFRV